MGSPFFRNSTPAAIRDRVSVLVRGEGGFTLIELMASALIILLIAAAVAQGLISSAHMSGYQRHRSQADELAQQDQERLRGMSTSQLDNLNQTVPVSLDGTNYTVTSTANFLNSTGGASCGSTGSGAAAYYSTTTTVAWKDTNGTQSISEHSLITPPIGGSLLVQTVDQTGAPLPGVTVSANGPDVVTGSTDGNGCLILADLGEGNYNLTLTDTGYVDKNGNLSPLATTASVTSSGTATPATGNPIAMGVPATLKVGQTTPTVVPGFTTPGYTTSDTPTTWSGKSDSVSWYGAGAAYQMNTSASQTVGASPVPAASLAGTFTVGNLFPFAFLNPVSYANDYQVWAGACRQEQPPAGVDGVTSGLGPGTTQLFTVQEPPVKLAVMFNGSAITTPPGHIKVTFQSTSGTNCTHSYYAPAAPASPAAYVTYNGWLAFPGLPFASAATSGPTASGSGLTGTLSICADYKSGATTYNYTQTGITNTSFTTPTPVTVAIPKNAGSVGSC